MTRAFKEIPTPFSANVGREALSAIINERSVIAGLKTFHRRLGSIFRMSAGAFKPVVLAGPEACHYVLVGASDKLSWRPEGDPVADLLDRGLLVTDGEEHDQYRQAMMPSVHKQAIGGYVESMLRCTDQMLANWPTDQPVDVREEMRRLSLLILMDNLYDIDMSADINHLLPHIIKSVRYISPGLWTAFPWVPRFGFGRSLRIVDEYLYRIIRDRRASGPTGPDILSLLIETELSDERIRDQLLTMLIAGHDTSTAQLAWTLYVIAAHPDWYHRLQTEIDEAVGERTPDLDILNKLDVLDRIIKEVLRLYPPIHIGNRIAAEDLTFDDYEIPAGNRVVYSIYATQRDPEHWQQPDTFDPDHFLPEQRQGRAHYAYLPFGGGARNCIGMPFAQAEAKIVIARILQSRQLELVSERVHQHMGATLDPHPEVLINARPRTK